MPFLRSYHVNGELLLRNRLVLRLGTLLLNRQLLERLIEIGVLLLRVRVTSHANGEDFHEVCVSSQPGRRSNRLTTK